MAPAVWLLPTLQSEVNTQHITEPQLCFLHNS